MNKNEAKRLLKRREELSELYQKLDNDFNSIDLSDNVNSIVVTGRSNIYNTISDIDVELSKYVKENPVGLWLLKIRGITTDLAAGLLIYFDVTGKECAAQFIKYAGSDHSNPHNNNVRKLIDKVISSLKAEPDGLYNMLNDHKFIELVNDEENEIPLALAHIRADRYMRKIFISHLFEEMYREHNGKAPNRHSDIDKISIEPEVPYTK